MKGIVSGTINDVLPGANAYLVSVPGSSEAVACIALSTAVNPFGARQIGMYQPGTPVLCMTWIGDNNARMGVIIGALPYRIPNRRWAVSDWIAPFAGQHALLDAANTHMLLTQEGVTQNHSFGQPLDGIPGHDQGVMQDLGLGYGVGFMEAWIRASDIAGLWCYYQDNLVRLAAYNFDFWHAGGERWIRNDQGEVSDVDGMTPYPWEAVGMWERAIAPFKHNAGEGNYKLDGGKLEYEPQAADQTGIRRHVITRGYLGGIYRHDVILPKRAIANAKTPARLSDQESFDLTGLSSVQEHVDGLYTVRSAKGIILEKYLFIPVPRQTAAPEQQSAQGDDAAKNYAPSGVQAPSGIGVDGGAANAVEHLRPILEPEDPGRPDMWIGQLFDMHAYIFNWLAVRPTVAHAKDWSLPDEGHFAHKEDDGDPWFGGVFVPSALLASTYTFGVPDAFDIDVDHNTRSRYYCSRSAVELLPDGSIAIEDGYGSGIYMSGGNVRITCAGDILRQSGRSDIAIAGDDVVLRAGSSIDVTAALGDVRLKAERNLHMLGGRGGEGGILLESKTGPISQPAGYFDTRKGEDALTAGIVMRVPAGSYMVFEASNMRFSAPSGGGNVGTIIFDATGGIQMNAAFHTRIATDGSRGFCDVGAGGMVMQAYTEQHHLIKASNVVISSAAVAVENDLLVGQRVLAGMGVVPIDNTDAAIQAIIDDATAWTADIANGQNTTAYFAATRLRSNWLLNARFTYRTPAQYGTDMASFYLVEARWQRAYREKGVLKGFAEPPVDGTMPYPGKEVWVDYNRYRLVDGTLFDWAEKRAVDREDPAYGTGKASPKIASLREVPFSDNYLISKQEVAQNIT